MRLPIYASRATLGVAARFLRSHRSFVFASGFRIAGPGRNLKFKVRCKKVTKTLLTGQNSFEYSEVSGTNASEGGNSLGIPTKGESEAHDTTLK